MGLQLRHSLRLLSREHHVVIYKYRGPELEANAETAFRAEYTNTNSAAEMSVPERIAAHALRFAEGVSLTTANHAHKGTVCGKRQIWE
jgi:hypothetical protein